MARIQPSLHPWRISMRHVLGLFFSWLMLYGVVGDSEFRFGAVLSTQGRSSSMVEAKNGYTLYFETINAEAEGRGFYLEGKANTPGFYFRYAFLWREDMSDPGFHSALVQELIEEDHIHFLGGSHADYAAQEMQIAAAHGVLNYHCCVEPDIYYGHKYPTVFGIMSSNRDYTHSFIQASALTLSEISGFMFVFQKDDNLTKTTCEAAQVSLAQAISFHRFEELTYSRSFNSSVHRGSFFEEVAREAQNLRVQTVLACVSADDGMALVNTFHDLQYPLKSFFLTAGPSRQDWVKKMSPPWRANDLYSAAQWFRKMQYPDDVFRSTLGYTERYEDRFEGQEATQTAAAASAVGLTLTRAIRDAFRDCDISRTQGDVDALLMNATAIDCDDQRGERGYDRVLTALKALDLETFFGRVRFNPNQRNEGLEPVTTQVFEQNSTAGDVVYEIEAVMPLSSATSFPKFPATNYYQESCLAGYFVGQDVFDPCEPCQRGEVSDSENAPRCDRCPFGQWMDSLAQSECFSCPEGTHTDIRGAKKLRDCFCMPGYFNIHGLTGLPCQLCPEGATCKGGIEPPVPKSTYWTHPDYRDRVYKCDSDTCIGDSSQACATGYTGRLCGECEEGYFSIIRKCHRCFNPILIVLLALALLIGWYVINVIVSRSVPSLEMILGWAQLANIIGDIDLNWTKSVRTLFDIANLLDFDVDILEPACLVQWGFRHNFVVQLCLPFIMSLMAANGYFGAFLAYNIMVKHKWIELDNRSLELLSIFVKVPKDSEQLAEKWDTTVATFLASVDIMYVTIAKYCFDVFKCEDIAGDKVMREDPSVICSDSSDHTTLVVLSALGIVFYVVAYPLYMSWKLYDFSYLSSFSSPVNLRRYGFIYEKYELDYSFTPVIMIARKLLFVLVLVYMNNPAFQVGTLALLIIVSLLVHVYTAPYVDTYLDVLFSFLLVALMCETFGGLMFYSENLPDTNREILEWIVLATAWLLTVVFLAILVLELVKKYHVRFLMKEHQKFTQRQLGPLSSFFGRMRRTVSQSTLEDRDSAKSSSEISYELLDTFHPRFVYSCIRHDPGLIQKWDKLTTMLKHYMSDQSETSYLSMDPVAKFWRKLVNRFPELIDFLAVADDATREKFNDFATNLYRNFYLSNKVAPLPLMKILNWRDYAPMAQWLAIASSEDRQFFGEFMAEMFRSSGNPEAADIMESRIQHGGPDPHLALRRSGVMMTWKKRRILHILRTGSHPFHHSAIETTRNNFSRLGQGLTRLVARHSRARASRRGRVNRHPTPFGVEATGDCLEETRSMTSLVRAQPEPPMRLQMSRSITFGDDTDLFRHRGN